MRLLLSLCAVASGAVVLVQGPAAANPGGAPCEAVITIPPGSTTASGHLFSDPVNAAGTLRCSLQSSEPHTAPDLAEATSANTGRPVVVHPTQVTVPLAPGAALYLCSEWTPSGGTTAYADHGPWGFPRNRFFDHVTWGDDPAAARCDRLVSGGADAQALRTAFDRTACPWIAFAVEGTLLGGTVVVESDGDVYVLNNQAYDCGGTAPAGRGNVYVAGASVSSVYVKSG